MLLAFFLAGLLSGSSSCACSLNSSRSVNTEHAALKERGVLFSPIPITSIPDSLNLLASLVKSPSEDTIQKPSTLLVYRISIASIISVESVAFFPTVLRNCWIGVIEFSISSFFHLFACVLVQSPYILLYVITPYLVISSNISEIYFEDILSESISTAYLLSSTFSLLSTFIEKTRHSLHLMSYYLIFIINLIIWTFPIL